MHLRNLQEHLKVVKLEQLIKQSLAELEGKMCCNTSLVVTNLCRFVRNVNKCHTLPKVIYTITTMSHTGPCMLSLVSIYQKYTGDTKDVVF